MVQGSRKKQTRRDRLAQRLDSFLGRIEGGHVRLRHADAALFKISRERGLVEQDQHGRWRLADAGNAWRRRLAAPDSPYLAQHAALEHATVYMDGVRKQVTVNAAESPLVWLRRRKGRDGAPLVSDEQFTAGERLRADFTRAHLMPSTTSRWDAALSGQPRQKGSLNGAADLLDSAVAARQRVDKVIAAVGPELSDVLIDVCCFLKGLNDVEQANAWPARSAKLVLQLGLTRLARHYGLLVTPQTRVRAPRHWGADGYRPQM